MAPKTILKAIADGMTVKYTVQILRGFTTGTRSMVFTPNMAHISPAEIAKRLRNFRHDEAPYDLPTWVVSDANGTPLKTIISGKRHENTNR